MAVSYIPTASTSTWTWDMASCTTTASTIGDVVFPITYTRMGSSPVMTPSGQQYTVNWAVNQGSKGVFPIKNLDPNKQYSLAELEEAWYDGMACNLESRDHLHRKREYLLPDGSKLRIDDAGNYQIDDKDAKVTYKANRIRDFSPHLNASDMLAKFVEHVATLGVKQSEVLGLPIELFINWLVIEAAERDKDPVPNDVVAVSKHQALISTVKPKCLSCGKFIPKEYHQKRFEFCNVDHGAAYAKKQLAYRQPALAR